MKFTSFVFSLIVLSPLCLVAQEVGAVRISEPVTPYVIDVDLRTLPRAPQWEPGMAVREVPRSSGNADVSAYAKPDGPDPLAGGPIRGISDPLFTSPFANIEGQGFSGSFPSDPTGDVGRFMYLQAINSLQGSQYTFYSKVDGSVVAGPFILDDLALGAACMTGNGDPSILYDHLADRWLISEYSQDKTAICIYISQTNDPITGGWFAYSFTTDRTAYNQLGLWRGAYLVNGNDLDGFNQAPKIRALDRDAMLQGLPATVITVDIGVLQGFSAQAATPATLKGATLPPEGSAGLFIRHRDDELHTPMTADGANDFLDLLELTLDFENPDTPMLSTTSIPVSEFDSGICFAQPLLCFNQPDGFTRVDVIHANVLSPLVYRNFGAYETLLGNFTVDADGSDTGGIRWFELRRDLTRGPATWTLHQEGTHAPGDGVNRWVGAVGMDKNGNIALGYNVVNGVSIYPGLRYTGRLAGDTAGMMTQTETNVISGTADNGSNRYGDYNGMAVDPDDDCTFWFTGNYNPARQWSTRIASFGFSNCVCALDAPVIAVTANGTDIDITWDAVADADSYQVYRAAGSCAQPTYTMIAQDVAGTAFTDTTLQQAGTYSYLVRAYDADADCLSAYSNCDAASVMTATIDTDRFACEVALEWTDPGAGVVVNIYRSETSGFTPVEENRIASCLEGTAYVDENVTPGTTYHYILRTEIVGSRGVGPCGGVEDTNLLQMTATPGRGIIHRVYDFENGSDGWSTAAGPGDDGGNAWALTTVETDGNGTSFFTANESKNKDQLLQTAEPIAATVNTRISFLHKYVTEEHWDGNVLEYSIDGGANWFDILAGNGAGIMANGNRLTGDGYVSILWQSSNEISGRRAWTGDSGGFVQTGIDLSDMAGEDVLLRWRHASDSSDTAPGTAGWWVDDVTLIELGFCICDALPAQLPQWPNTDILNLVIACP
ncbi:MAG: hypothetical protein QNK37_34005 [Acidobacteriota bacterium]|nr:hypothetical protein [Acidobacteriota bacterium]